MQDVCVLYHKNCADGFTAAWVLAKKFSDATFIPVNHGEKSIPNVKHKNVIVVDFCYPLDQLQTIKNSTLSLLVLDHHITAMQQCGHLDYCKFDLSQSGAGLAWSFAFEEPKPLLVKLIEFRDLGHLWNNHSLSPHPEAEKLLAAIDSFDKTFEIWDQLDTLLNSLEGIASLTLQGEAILRYQKTLVERLVQSRHHVQLDLAEGTLDCIAVNSSILQSELGDRLSKSTGLPALIYYQGRDFIKFSLRSGQTGYNVASISKQFRLGGGHKQAAGFSLEGRLEFPNQKINLIDDPKN